MIHPDLCDSLFSCFEFPDPQDRRPHSSFGSYSRLLGDEFQATWIRQTDMPLVSGAPELEKFDLNRISNPYPYLFAVIFLLNDHEGFAPSLSRLGCVSHMEVKEP